MRPLVTLLAALFALSVAYPALARGGEAASRQLSVPEMKSLVRQYWKDSGMTNYPGVQFADDGRDTGDGFHVFDAIWDNRGPGSINAGHFAVDERTGDIWDGVVCVPYTSPNVEALKRKLRRRIGLSDVGYRKIKRMGQYCEDGPLPPPKPYPAKLSLADETAIVLEYSRESGEAKLRQFAIAPDSDDEADMQYPGLRLFGRFWDSPQDQSNWLAQVFVDVDTGDLWADGRCRRISSPGLTRLQLSIRRRIGIPDTAYRRLRHPGPDCTRER